MAILFDRVVQVIISSDNEKITIPKDIDTINNLQINFTIGSTQTGSNAENNEVMFTNLAEKTRNFIKKEAQKVEIFAGYRSIGAAKIAQGQITNVEKINRQGSDLITRVQFSEAIFDINNLLFNKSYIGAISLVSILNDSIVGTSFTFRNVQVIPNNTLDGFSFDGKTKDLFTKLLTPIKINWVVIGEKIAFNKVGSVNSDSLVFKISKSTGLIGVPKPTQSAGVEFKTLLNTQIAIGDKAKLDSQFISGEFKVISLQHKGSSRAGDFSTTIDCVAL